MPLVIACASDESYAMALGVMLKTAAAHTEPGRRVEVHIVADGVGPALREDVGASLPPSVTLHWIERPPGNSRDLPIWGRMSPTTYRKLTLGEWLPGNVERAIWLDCDILVLGDLGRLWRMDTGGHTVLAVQDALVPTAASRFGIAAHDALGIPGSSKYFNAGVMMIDVARWRREKVADKALAYLSRHRRDVWFWDQEALNVAMFDRWRPIDPRWNWSPLRDRLAGPQSDAPTDPWIIHFSGSLKPWQYPGSSPNHSRYFHWIDQTAWRGFRPARTLHGRALAAYERTRVRALLAPLERMHLRLVRWWTRQ